MQIVKENSEAAATRRRKELNKEIDEYLVYVYSRFNSAKKIDEKQLPTHKEFMCKAALEYKFNKDFSLEEVRAIIADKSWQWRKKKDTHVSS